METVPRSWASRLIRNPIAIIGAIGSIFVVLANAEPAMDGATHIWHRWTQPPARLETTWQGSWKSRDGFNYALAMQLQVTDSGAADGQITWELVATPPGSFCNRASVPSVSNTCADATTARAASRRSPATKYRTRRCSPSTPINSRSSPTRFPSSACRSIAADGKPRRRHGHRDGIGLAAVASAENAQRGRAARKGVVTGTPHAATKAGEIE